MTNHLMNTILSTTFEKEVDDAQKTNTVNAIKVVIDYTISDAFDLSPEESLWVGWHLQDILEPLTHERPEALQVAVKQELDTLQYSTMLFDRNRRPGAVTGQAKNVKYASLDEWCEAISEIIFASYPNLRPLIVSRVIGGISGLLTELGVTNDKRSRASLYLPNALRQLLQQRNQNQ